MGFGSSPNRGLSSNRSVMAAKQFPHLLGHGEIASLYGVERQTGGIPVDGPARQRL